MADAKEKSAAVYLSDFYLDSGLRRYSTEEVDATGAEIQDPDDPCIPHGPDWRTGTISTPSSTPITRACTYALDPVEEIVAASASSFGALRAGPVRVKATNTPASSPAVAVVTKGTAPGEWIAAGLAIARTSGTISGSGTILSGFNVVVGTGTLFTTEVHIGDIINANSQSIAVTAITDDTHLTTAIPFLPILAPGTSYTITPPGPKYIGTTKPNTGNTATADIKDFGGISQTVPVDAEFYLFVHIQNGTTTVDSIDDGSGLTWTHVQTVAGITTSLDIWKARATTTIPPFQVLGTLHFSDDGVYAAWTAYVFTGVASTVGATTTGSGIGGSPSTDFATSYPNGIFLGVAAASPRGVLGEGTGWKKLDDNSIAVGTSTTEFFAESRVLLGGRIWSGALATFTTTGSPVTTRIFDSTGLLEHLDGVEFSVGTTVTVGTTLIYTLITATDYFGTLTITDTQGNTWATTATVNGRLYMLTALITKQLGPTDKLTFHFTQSGAGTPIEFVDYCFKVTNLGPLHRVTTAQGDGSEMDIGPTGNITENEFAVAAYGVRGPHADTFAPDTGWTLQVGDEYTASDLATLSIVRRITSLDTIDAPTITTGPACHWDVVSNDSWIHIDDPSFGEGNGVISAHWDANTDEKPRIGRITVNTETFILIQLGTNAGVTVESVLPCTYAIDPPGQSADPEGADYAIEIDPSDQDCTWEAASEDTWITILDGDSGAGTGTVSYRVANNPSVNARTGHIKITGKSSFVYEFTVLQPGHLPSSLPARPGIDFHTARAITRPSMPIRHLINAIMDPGGSAQGDYIPGKIYVMPFVTDTGVISEVSMYVTSRDNGGSGTPAVALGIYRQKADGSIFPGDLLFSGVISTTSVGLQALATGIPVEEDTLYFAAAHFGSTNGFFGAVGGVFRSVTWSGCGLNTILGLTEAGRFRTAILYSRGYDGTLPTPFPTTGYTFDTDTTNGQLPGIFISYSA